MTNKKTSVLLGVFVVMVMFLSITINKSTGLLFSIKNQGEVLGASTDFTTSKTWYFKLPVITITIPPVPTPSFKFIIPATSYVPTLTKSQITNTSGNTQKDSLLQEINVFRASKGLGKVQPDSYSCNFADVRAQEITSSFSHDGFQNRINSKTLPYPHYSLVVENLALNSNVNNVVSSWINSPSHAENMLKNTTYGCIGISGNYYTYEAYTP